MTLLFVTVYLRVINGKNVYFIFGHATKI